MWFQCVFGWIAMLLVVVRSEVHPDAESRVFLRAQCKAMCLQYFGQTDEFAINKIQNRLRIQNDLVSDCFRKHKDKCSDTCFSACDRLPSNCRSTCSVVQVDSVGCHLGCSLLDDIYVNRPGECPQSNVPSDEENRNRFPAPPCHKLCHNDISCSHPLQKCCAFGCNRNCTIPTFSEMVPPIPPRLTLHPVGESSDVMLITLDNKKTNYSSNLGPHVFIFQMRFYTCENFSEEAASPWQTILMAVETSTTMDTFSSDRRYQFRLAAVNAHGSRGFGPASQPYLFIPLHPEPPSNVTATKWRINPKGEVSVHLSWSAPGPTFLPLMNYSVSWALNNGQATTTTNEPLKASNVPFKQSAQTKDTEITINSLLLNSSYIVQVTSIYSHNQGILKSLPQKLFISTQFLLPVYQQPSATFESAKYKPTTILDGNEFDKDDDDGTCRCNSLGRNDERLEINPPEVFNEDLTALVQFKSFSHMDTQSYLIEWFPQVCIDSTENAPITTPNIFAPSVGNAGTATKQSIGTNSEVHTATVRSRIFRITELKFNCVYMVRLTPEAAVGVTSRLGAPAPSHSRRRQQHLVQGASLLTSSPSDATLDVIQGCFCTRSCRETKTAWGTKPIDCPAAEPEPPKPPRDIQVKLINFDRLDYQVSWYPPSPMKGSGRGSPSSATTAALVSSAPFTRYRVLWAPRKEEPVEAFMYNDEAGFSPIPDLQHSYVRVLDRNKTSLILPRLRPRTFYILKIQTLGPADSGQERESLPALHYFFTHDDGFHNNKRANDKGVASQLQLSSWALPWMTVLHIRLLSYLMVTLR